MSDQYFLSAPVQTSAPGFQCSCGEWVSPGTIHTCRPSPGSTAVDVIVIPDPYQWRLDRIIELLEKIERKIDML